MTPFSVRKRIIEVSKKVVKNLNLGKTDFKVSFRDFPTVKVTVVNVETSVDFKYADITEDGDLTIYYPYDAAEEDLKVYKDRLPFIISHELTHLFQFKYSDYFDEDEKESNSYYEYLTQDYEMDAEVTLLLHIMEHCDTFEEALKEYIWNFFSLQSFQDSCTSKSFEKIYNILEKDFGEENYFGDGLNYFVVFLKFLSSPEFISKLKQHSYAKDIDDRVGPGYGDGMQLSTADRSAGDYH